MSLGELRRILGTATGVAVCCGMAVGAGILRTPGEVAKHLTSAAWVYVVWCVGALGATLDAFILAEMSAMLPRVGGLVAYIRLSYGPAAAFLVGWSMLLVTWPASLASVAVITGELITGGATTLASDASTAAGRNVAVAVIAGLGSLNLIGLRFGARFEVALVFVKMSLLAAVCVATAIAAPAHAQAAVPVPSSENSWLGHLGLAMAPVIWSYDGYADAVYMAGETRDPGRALPRALLTALLAITGLYLLANATFLHVLGMAGLSESKFAALEVAKAAFGESGERILTAVALVVLLGAVNGYFLTGPRIARILAEEGLAVRALGQVPESGAPVAGTLWIIVVSCAFALTNEFSLLIDITVPIISATTMLVALGLLLQRARAPGRPRPFRVHGAPLVVALQIALCLAMLGLFVAGNPVALAIDAGALLVGLLCYAAIRRPRPEVPS
jgi:APA family basic amino acid/polyamine antiporter